MDKQKFVIGATILNEEYYRGIIKRIYERYLNREDMMPRDKERYYDAKAELTHRQRPNSKNPVERERLSRKMMAAWNEKLNWCSGLDFDF